jgi:hypothetical protein
LIACMPMPKEDKRGKSISIAHALSLNALFSPIPKKLSSLTQSRLLWKAIKAIAKFLRG